MDGTDRRSRRPGRLPGWAEVVFLVFLYQTYSFLRAQVSGDYGPAYHHADQVYRLERATGLLVEKHVQDAFLPYPFAVQVWNVFYGTVHFIVPVVTLVVLWRLAPERYVRMKRTIFALTLMALVVFATWPLAPPRYWPTEVDPFLVDTAVRFGPFDPGGMEDATNPWAAMPSLHVGWSTWCPLALFPVLWRRGRRVWAGITLLDPVVTSLAVMATGNHWIIDGFAGQALLAVAFAGVLATERLKRRRHQRWAAARPAQLGEPRKRPMLLPGPEQRTSHRDRLP